MITGLPEKACGRVDARCHVPAFLAHWLDMNKRTSVPSPSPSEGNARPHRMLLCRQDAIISDHGICMPGLAHSSTISMVDGGGRDCLRPVATVPCHETSAAARGTAACDESVSGVGRGRAARTGTDDGAGDHTLPV